MKIFKILPLLLLLVLFSCTSEENAEDTMDADGMEMTTDAEADPNVINTGDATTDADLNNNTSADTRTTAERTVAEREATYIFKPLGKVDLTPTNEDGSYALEQLETQPLFSAECKSAKEPAACNNKAIEKYMGDKLKFPEEAGVESSVQYVVFTVQADGTVSDRNVMVRNAQGEQCNACMKQAIEAVRGMPKWQPAKIKGVSVPAKLVLPVRFQEI